MQPTYYTPEIEEFHVGFEYETCYIKEDWEKQILSKEDIGYFFESYRHDATPSEYRVKNLDQQDIEELGWVRIEYDTFQYRDCKLEFNPEYKNFIYEANFPKSTLFAGTIRNKSELRKVMKMLNIL